MPTDQPSDQPNVLFVMTDQQRFDTIAALGHSHVSTPNHDRLVERGVSFTNAYSPAPVCVPARHTVRTGCDPITTGYLGNDNDSSAAYLEDRCGPFLARRMGELGYRTFGVGKFHERPVGLDLRREPVGPRAVDGEELRVHAARLREALLQQHGTRLALGDRHEGVLTA